MMTQDMMLVLGIVGGVLVGGLVLWVVIAWWRTRYSRGHEHYSAVSALSSSSAAPSSSSGHAYAHAYADQSSKDIPLHPLPSATNRTAPRTYTVIDNIPTVFSLNSLFESLDAQMDVAEVQAALQLASQVPRGEITVATADINRTKNRDPQFVPYDSNRFILPEESSYINASHIPGLPGCGSYIATQGPSNNTAQDFWEMVWTGDVQTIVMLNRPVENGVEKTFKYWSDSQRVTFGFFEIARVGQKQFDQFWVRNFLVRDTRTKKTRTISHFSYSGWSAESCPSSPEDFLTFVLRVRHSCNTSAPLLVHCDTGGGRTGTFILIDSLLQQINAGSVELAAGRELCRLRKLRGGLVETAEQYGFALCCLSEELKLLEQHVTNRSSSQSDT